MRSLIFIDLQQNGIVIKEAVKNRMLWAVNRKPQSNMCSKKTNILNTDVNVNVLQSTFIKDKYTLYWRYY